MRGKITNFYPAQGQGSIQGEDGQNYLFTSQYWTQTTAPIVGQSVEFILDINGQISNIQPLAQSISLSKNPSIDNVYVDPTVNPYQAPQYMGGQVIPTAEVNPIWAIEENYGFFDWVKKCFRNYANFNGRARRKEYWFFYLFYVIAYIAFISIDISLELNGILFIIGCLAMVLPYLAVTIRRLHDVNKSGWWMFISLIPLIGGIVYIVWLCTETKPETNQWGMPARRV